MFFLENSSMGGFDRATDEIRTRGAGGGGAAAAAAEGHETRHRPVEHQVRGGENPHSYRITANSFSLFLLFNSVPQISSSIKHNSQGGAPSCE
jgi:hypothetical protein